MGTNSKDSFTDFPSLDFDDLNYDGSPFDEDPLSDSSQYQQSSESWEDFQSLSPFGLDWEMEQEFFKSDITDLECKKQGPTLAELNNQRSTSPLINPEMERLHRIATRSELEQSSSSSPCDIKIRVDGPDNSEASKKNMLSCTRTKNNDGYSVESYPQGLNSQSCGSGMRAQESTVIPRVNASSTITIKQEPTETIELKHSDLMKRIAYLEAKSNSQDANAQSSGVQNFTDVTAHSNRRRTSSECSSIDDEHLSVIREESADEDMDSDDDFEENHVKDNLEVPAKQRKGRRGDVEDMNPNPRKLLEISRELNRLTKIITDLKPIHSLPMTSRNKSKKEKNKLASRLVYNIVRNSNCYASTHCSTLVRDHNKLSLTGIMLLTRA